MSTKPVFVATHPRACSTAFERVFMTRRNSIHTIHEPFGDAFYFGPERLGSRFENDEESRVKSGFSDSTFKTIVDRIDQEAAEGKRVFIKDITYYLFPPTKQSGVIAPSLHKLDHTLQVQPSLQRVKRGVGTDGESAKVNGDDSANDHDSGIGLETPGTPRKTPPFPYENGRPEADNPTVVPREFLEKFHFTFLIRHPKSAIPSYYRCCIPPLVERTQFNQFMPEEAGYDELRRLFDYLKSSGMIGPNVCGQGESKGKVATGQVEICIVDADDMLDDPEGILRQYCESIGLDFDQQMLNWDSDEAHQFAREQFLKWDGFHDDAINSTDLKPRKHKKAPKSDEEMYADWQKLYGQEAADMIKKTVDDNVADYEYLKQFAIKKP